MTTPRMIETQPRLDSQRVESLEVRRDDIHVTDGWVRVARVKDEQWREAEVVPTANFRRLVREAAPGADLFTFIQKPPAPKPLYQYHLEWLNLAVVETRCFQDWWEKQLPQVTRKNVRRAARRGVVVRPVECCDNLVCGITEIYNEVPIRDGRPFPHYGKKFDTVKREVTTMPDRSEFLGAYCGEELIGFIKLVHMGKLSSILYIVSKRAHYDKRPSNALLAAAVEVCSRRGVEYLIYGQYHYGKRSNGPLTEFKRRNGFIKVLVPRYFIPLTFWGRVCLALRLHRGITGMLPTRCLDTMLSLRSKYYEKRLNRFLSLQSQPAVPGETDVSD